MSLAEKMICDLCGYRTVRLKTLLDKAEQQYQVFDKEIMDLKLAILRLIEWIKEADQDRDFDPQWKELNAIMERLK